MKIFRDLFKYEVELPKDHRLMTKVRQIETNSDFTGSYHECTFLQDIPCISSNKYFKKGDTFPMIIVATSGKFHVFAMNQFYPVESFWPEEIPPREYISTK